MSVRVSVCLSFCKNKNSNGCTYQKMLVYKVVTFLKRIKMAILFLDFFGSDPSKMDQTWSNWISNQSKNVTIKSCHIYRKDKNGCLFLIFLDQICPKWIKLDQTWSNWISHQSKNVTITNCHIYRKDKNDRLIFDFFGSDLSKMDQTWSNWISHQSKNVTIKSCHIHHENKHCQLFFDQIRWNLSKNGSKKIKFYQIQHNLT